MLALMSDVLYNVHTNDAHFPGRTQVYLVYNVSRLPLLHTYEWTGTTVIEDAAYYKGSYIVFVNLAIVERN